MSLTPFFWQLAYSFAFMRRDALAMSGNCGPTPLQKSLMPPPVPVLSTFGVLNLPPRPNCSATVVVNGYTVDEPTMLMESRAACACAVPLRAQTMPAASEEMRMVRVTVLPPVVTGGSL
jgi:hypothetical protein